MKRLRHWLFNFAAAVSMSVCLLTGVLWVVSYWSRMQASYMTGNKDSYSFIWVSGKFGASFMHSPFFKNSAGWDRSSSRLSKGPGIPLREQLAFRVQTKMKYAPEPQFKHQVYSLVPLQTPGFVLPLATLVLPAAWARSAIKHRRRVNRGHCPACGYDLRATPDKCPECGAIPTAANGAAT